MLREQTILTLQRASQSQNTLKQLSKKVQFY